MKMWSAQIVIKFFKFRALKIMFLMRAYKYFCARNRGSAAIRIVAALFLAISFFSCYLAANGAIKESSLAASFVTVMTSIVPGVYDINNGSVFFDVGRFVFSIQWLGVPIYFFLLICVKSPFSIGVRRELVAKINHGKRETKSVLFFSWIILFLILLSDTGFIFWPSLYRGYVFGNVFPMLKHSMIWLSIEAWIFCLLQAIIYWYFLILTVTFAFAIRDQNFKTSEK